MQTSRKIVIPPEIRKLQRPWFSQNTEPELEGMIRKGARIQQRFGEYIQMRSIQGSMTMTGIPLSPERAMHFLEASKSEYPPLHPTSESAAREEKEHLRIFLEHRGVELRNGHVTEYSEETYKTIRRILNLVPDHHFGHQHFTRFRIAGWGSGSAKCSRYEDSEVHLYQFAMEGPTRNLIGLTLHEIGHSFEWFLSPEDMTRLKRLMDIVEDKNAVGVDFLHGKKYRIMHAFSSLPEFIAETYLNYISQGAFTQEGFDLRRRIDSREFRPGEMPETSAFASFLHSIDPQRQRAWLEIWAIYQKGFNGIEYV